MDLLVAYESDSDEDINSYALNRVDDTDQQPPPKKCENCMSVEPEHASVYQNGASSRTKHVEYLEESSGMSFFGLDKTDEMEKQTFEESSEDTGSISQPKFVQILGQKCQVPEGSFWKNISESDIVNKCINIEPDCRKRKSDTPWVQFEPRIKMDNAVICMSKQLDTVTVENISHDFSSTSDSHGISRLEGELQKTVNVKVYAVHPKIAPHLNSHQANRCPTKEVHLWAGHSGVINRLSWCSAAPYSHLLLSASMDTTVRVWNAWAQNQPCVRTLRTHTKAVRDAQWSEDGQKILSSSYDRTAAITDVQTGQCCTSLDHPNFVSCGKFHPVMPYIVATGTNESIQVWDIRSPEVPCRTFTYKEHLGQVQDLMFSHDGQELFSCSEMVSRDSSDRSIMAWDFKTGVTLSNQIFQERYTVTRLCLHPKLNQFIAQTQGSYAAIFSTQRPYKMNKNMRFEGHKTAGYNIGLSVSRDGSLVYTGCAEGKLHCYNFHNARKIRTFDCRGDVVMDAVCHPVLPSAVACATWSGNLHVFQ